MAGIERQLRGVFRRAIVGWLRLVGESAERVSETSISVLRRMGELPRGPEHAVVSALTAQVREILDLPPPGGGGDGPLGEEGGDAELLRRRFSELLDRSREVAPQPGAHPAFRSIIGDISPDEARIIRLFDDDGPQPVVQVVAAPLIGTGERTVAEHLTLIGDRAGCHEPERTAGYLENLRRLGVIRIDDDELVGHGDYELIEALPAYEEAAEHITEQLRQRAHSERGSARLTSLGEQFCEVCLRDGAA